MKNYLCLNGKKIELTPEQVHALTGESGYDVSLDESGEIARVGKYEFIMVRLRRALGRHRPLLRQPQRRRRAPGFALCIFYLCIFG